MKLLLGNESGGVAIFSALAAVVGIGAAALAIDYGRVGLLKTQMQNRADAGALAAAARLDGADGARAMAQQVAIGATSATTGIASDSAQITVQSVSFFSAYTPTPVAATSDLEAKYVRVTLQARQLDYFFAPILNLVSSTNGPTSLSVTASAVARVDPFICNAPPLMMCDPAESDPSLSLSDPANVGRQFRLKEAQAGGGTWAPGVFGLLALPDGASGANDIGEALAAVEPEDCYTLDVTTAPGSKTNQIRDGINARFDLPGGGPDPAPNVINYTRDDNIVADPAENFGDGVWDLDTYWADKHGGGTPPAELDQATRYMVYLYEQGLAFARNGKQILYPVPANLPAGYTLVSPAAADIPVAADPANANDPDFDGVPGQTVASNGEGRRLLRIAVLQCQADGVNGSGTYPTSGNFVEMFVTETVKDPPDAAIYGELVRPLSPTNLPDFHANVQLIQ